MTIFTQIRRPGSDGAIRRYAEPRFPASGVLMAFLCGAVSVVAAMTIDRSVFAAACVILAVLSMAVAMLNRLAERTDERLLAGDASYPHDAGRTLS
jgi:hypothetical protein